MLITSPSDFAVLITLAAMILLVLTAFLVCLQRPRDQIQRASVPEQDPRQRPRG
jgi:hypothetical protein